jgi:hypothetical protein
MKIDQLCKYVGILSLVITSFLMLFGIIGYFAGEFLNVKNFSTFFWFANPFALFGLLNFATYFVLKKEG